jgi:hypothetical protein
MVKGIGFTGWLSQLLAWLKPIAEIAAVQGLDQFGQIGQFLVMRLGAGEDGLVHLLHVAVILGLNLFQSLHQDFLNVIQRIIDVADEFEPNLVHISVEFLDQFVIGLGATLDGILVRPGDLFAALGGGALAYIGDGRI